MESFNGTGNFRCTIDNYRASTENIPKTIDRSKDRYPPTARHSRIESREEIEAVEEDDDLFTTLFSRREETAAESRVSRFNRR